MGRRISSITFRLLAFGPLALLLLLTQTAEAVPQLPRAFFGTVDVGANLADDEILAEAAAYHAQQQAFETAAPRSDAGLYQIKKAKESARVLAR